MTGKEYSALFDVSASKAHRALFDEYYGYVFTVVYGNLGGFAREDVEECTSDVFAEVFFALDGGSGFKGELKGYIATVAKRRAIDKFRALSARKRRAPLSLDDADFDSVTADGSVEEDAENAEVQQRLLDCVEALGQPDSTIIIQKFYFNRSSREIAQELNMKPSAVRMRCARALQKLKRSLDDIDM